MLRWRPATSGGRAAVVCAWSWMPSSAATDLLGKPSAHRMTRQRRSASNGATSFLHARPKCQGRSPRLRISDPLHPRWPPRPVRPVKLAGCCSRRSTAHWNSRREHQCRRPHARDVAIAMAAVPKTGPDITRSYVWSISETGPTIRRRYNRQPGAKPPDDLAAIGAFHGANERFCRPPAA